LRDIQLGLNRNYKLKKRSVSIILYPVKGDDQLFIVWSCLLQVLNQKLDDCSQAGVSALVEELNRVNSENQKLTEVLGVVCEKYLTLQKHLADLTSKNSEKELMTTPVISMKRKAESEDYSNVINAINGGNTESSSSDEDSSKRPQENLKTKISRAYFPTNASDTSLVSSLINILITCL
jgi:predicted DNA-binding ribbon-helix-helix protein